jgi:PAS domain S-box-containing protein
MDTSRVIEANALSRQDPAGTLIGPVAGADALRPRVLVVDDDERNLLAVRALLADFDIDIVLAHSGEEALRALLNQTFAVMLLDVKMPGIDGYETAAIVRSRSKTRVMPIIFLTAYNKEDADVFQGYSAGAVDYVIKPIDPVVLRSKVSVFVELYRTSAELRRQVEVERRLRLENQEVRAQKQEVEEALRRVEEQRSLIIRSLPVAVYSADLNGAGPRYLSEGMARVSGFAAVDFLHDPDLWLARVHPADQARLRGDMAAAASAGTLTAEYRWRCADGSERWFLDHGVVLRNSDGEPHELVGTCLDVTERRELEQELAHSQKMEAIGKLTGGIAHDFNNMLTIVIGNLDMLCRGIEAGAERDRAQMALTGALNCAELTRRLLAVARRQSLRPKVLDFADLLPDVAKLLRRALGEKVEVRLEMADGLWRVEADPTQVESALLNLAINARDAMPSGGVFEIAAANLQLEKTAAQKVGAAPGDYVVLTARDTGVGMPPEIAARVFEPFFTTKDLGRGTGLGLSTIYGFIMQSGGFVELDSEEGRGTTIRIGLPRTDRVPELEPPPAQRAGERSGVGHTILLVEDDDDVRQITRTLLGGMGYRVLEAARAAAALSTLEAEPAIDLLLTDVVMPGGMGGIELAREAVQRRPALRVLLTSGYAEVLASSPGISAELLQKPYRFEELVRKLDALLAA